VPTVGRQPSWVTILDTAAPVRSSSVVAGSALVPRDTARIEDYSLLLLRDERTSRRPN
jgi:hypothetical protein